MSVFFFFLTVAKMGKGKNGASKVKSLRVASKTLQAFVAGIA
jgi:hypothetical protein